MAKTTLPNLSALVYLSHINSMDLDISPEKRWEKYIALPCIQQEAESSKCKLNWSIEKKKKNLSAEMCTYCTKIKACPRFHDFKEKRLEKLE